jgi:hypothetical protein
MQLPEEQSRDHYPKAKSGGGKKKRIRLVGPHHRKSEYRARAGAGACRVGVYGVRGMAGLDSEFFLGPRGLVDRMHMVLLTAVLLCCLDTTRAGNARAWLCLHVVM